MAAAKRSPEATQELRDSLIEAAKRIVSRDGAQALTMQALAAEAGCAVGLPYKVFGGRADLVGELVHAEFVNIRRGFDELIAAAGSGTVGDNLGRYAELILDSPSVALAREVAHDQRMSDAIDDKADESGVVDAVATTVTKYLVAEKRLGRVAPDVDEDAFGFVISGAVHNLLVSGDLYPRPSPQRLKEMLAAVAKRLTAST